MYNNFKLFLLQKYKDIFKYWKLSIVLYIIIVVSSLSNCSLLLKLSLFFFLQIFIFAYIFLYNLIINYNITKKILSSVSCVKTNEKLFNIITIIIFIGFVLAIFFLSLTNSKDPSIIAFKINLELRLFITVLGTVTLLITYGFGYLLTQLPKLYKSLLKTSNKYNHVTEPSKNTTLIGWGILLIVILVWFSISEMFEDSPQIVRYSIKSFVCILIIFLYLSYVVSYNLSYLQKNYYHLVNKKNK